MASSVDGTSLTLTDDGNGEDTSGEVTHDIDSNSILSKPSKVRKRCVKNNNDDDDDDGNSGVNKYPRVNGDADVSSCRTEFTDEVLSDRYNLCHAILLPSTGVSERHIKIVLRLADDAGIKYGLDIPDDEGYGQEYITQAFYDALPQVNDHYSKLSNGLELLKAATGHYDDDDGMHSSDEEGGDDEGGVTDTTIDSTSNNNYSFGYDRGVDDGCIDFTNNGGGIMGLDINDGRLQSWLCQVHAKMDTF